MAATVWHPQGTHSHILITGGGGPSDLFGSEILAQSYFFGSMKDAEIFLGRKKRAKGFWGYAKKSSDFLWWTNSEVVNFLV